MRIGIEIEIGVGIGIVIGSDTEELGLLKPLMII